MAKKAYIGVSSKARKSKKIYIGVGGKARKVKKGYVGVNGKARLFFQAQREISADSTLAQLSNSEHGRNWGISFNNYAIFTPHQTKIEAFNDTLTISTFTINNVNGSYDWSPIEKFGDNFLIIGPPDNHYGSGYGAADNAFTSISVTNPSRLLQGQTSSRVGNYALFCSGLKYSNSSYYEDINIYSSTLTLSQDTYHTKGRYPCAFSVGRYACFLGGEQTYTVYSNKMTVFDSSLTKSTPSFSVGYYESDSRLPSFEDHAVLGAFQNSTSTSRTGITANVKTINNSLTVSNLTSFSIIRYSTGCAAVDGYALFMGGYGDKDNAWKSVRSVDIYDENYTRTTRTLKEPRILPGVAAVNSHIIVFAGACTGYYKYRAEASYEYFAIN